MKIISKDSRSQIAYRLSSNEFRCRCRRGTCTAILIDERLLESWTILRKKLNVPIWINSGYRCQAHNNKIGGKKLSRHLLGQALDIDYESLSKYYKVEVIISVAREAGFTFIKFYSDKNFIHMDVRERK